jgi:tetratricopeptide (TPR) repeat protein
MKIFKNCKIILIIGLFICNISQGFGQYQKKGFLAGLNVNYLNTLEAFKGELDPGIGIGFSGIYLLNWNNLFVESNLNYSSFDIKASPGSKLSQASIVFGPGIFLFNSRLFNPYVSSQIGINYLLLSVNKLNKSQDAFKPAITFEGGVMIPFYQHFNLRIGSCFNINEINGGTHISNGFMFSIMMRTDVLSNRGIVSKKKSLVKIMKIDFEPIFGARYSTYKTNGIGHVIVKNVSNKELKDIRIETTINEINSGPTVSEPIKTILPNVQNEIELPVIINKDILNLRESRELSIKLRAYYSTNENEFSYIEKKTILVHPKNAITWDETAHLGSFITPREEIIAEYARNVLSKFKDKSVPGVPIKIQQAIILYDTLGAAGITYVTDPNTGFSKLGKNTLDYVMFARETLKNKAGDCDDLTVLYASLLESIGVKTAIITIPGHVFMMLDTEVPSNSYRNVTQIKSYVHFMNGTVWIPIEITMVGKTFLDSWKEGSKSVNRYKTNSQEFDVHETALVWSKFPPEDIGADSSITIPELEGINKLYDVDIDQIKTMGYDEIVESLTAKLKNNKEDYKILNSLGAISGRFRKMEDAIKYFNKAVKINPQYANAYANLGNVYIFKKKFEKAIKFWEKAVQLVPSNHKYRLGLARVYFEIGRKYKAKKEYLKALEKQPGYSRRYAYLSNDLKTRAADLNVRVKYNLWEE